MKRHYTRWTTSLLADLRALHVGRTAHELADLLNARHGTRMTNWAVHYRLRELGLNHGNIHAPWTSGERAVIRAEIIRAINRARTSLSRRSATAIAREMIGHLMRTSRRQKMDRTA